MRHSLRRYASFLGRNGVVGLFVIALIFGGALETAQAAVTFVACGTTVRVASGDLASVGIPAGIQNNDILVTYVHERDNVNSSMPVGWTNNVAGNGNAINRLEIFWKRTTGSESAPTVTHTAGDSAIAVMCAFRGSDTSGDPFNVVGSVQSNAGATISTAAITTTVSGAMILHVFGSQDDNAWGSFTGFPINQAAQSANTLGTDDSSVLTYGLQATSGGTGAAGATETTNGTDASVSVQMALRPTPITTIGNGADPSNAGIAPGASETDLDTFTLQTSFGLDTVTAATVALAAGSSGGLSLVALTSNDGLTTYCSQANPSSDTVSLSSCGIPVTTSAASFKVRITPKSHASMPAPPGATYSVTGTVTSFSSANSQSGTDSGSATVTIDNASPANVTGGSGAAGNAQVGLSWTNPINSDFQSVIALRSTSAVADTPVEGTTYSAGTAIGASTVACVVASPGTSCTDTGLTNGTAYHYKLFSRDTNGNYSTGVVPAGSPVTPAVPADITAPAAVTNLAASNPTASSIDLSWTAPGDDGNTGTATTYDIRYSTAVITDGNWASATQVAGEPAPQVAGTSQSMTVTGLLGGTTYYFAMKTRDEVLNESGLSNVTSAATQIAPDTTAPAAITDLAAANPTASTVDLSWTAPGDDGSSGTAASYDIRYSTLTITDANWPSATQASGEPTPHAAGTPESMTVPGLSASTAYFFAIRASDEVPNTSNLSNVGTATTLPGGGSPPPPPPPGPPPASPPGPSGGAGVAVRPSEVSISGQAYPGSSIEVFRRGTLDETYRNEPITAATAVAADGTFTIAYTGLLGADYVFAVRVTDKEGRKTGFMSFNVNLQSGNLSVGNLFAPPTLSASRLSVTKGNTVALHGYAAALHTVQMQVDGILTDKATAGEDGSYAFMVDTTGLTIGTHYAQTRALGMDGKGSSVSLPVAFRVSLLAYPRADFNSDNRVDITDWSIFLARWGTKEESQKAKIDFDDNGKVDIADLSIFLKAMKL